MEELNTNLATLPPPIPFVAPGRQPRRFAQVLTSQRYTVESLIRRNGGGVAGLVNAEWNRLGGPIWCLSDPLRAAAEPADRESALALAVAAHAAHAAQQAIAFVVAVQESDPNLFRAWGLHGLAADALILLNEASELGHSEVASYEIPSHVLTKLMFDVRDEYEFEAEWEAWDQAGQSARSETTEQDAEAKAAALENYGSQGGPFTD